MQKYQQTCLADKFDHVIERIETDKEKQFLSKYINSAFVTNSG